MESLALILGIAVSIVIILTFILKPFERFRKLPIVLVHSGFFIDPPRPEKYYFIKVNNLSEKKDYTITHIDIKDLDDKIYHNLDKRLPHKLKPSDPFETWVDVSEIKDSEENVFNNVRVLLSTGKVLKSKFNKGVPEQGNIGNLNSSDYST